MSDSLGIIVPAAIQTLGNPGARARRSIGDIVANITVEEKHVDEMVITDHPVEQGSSVTDHAYKMPAEVIIRASWSNSPGLPSGPLGGTSALLQSVISGQVGNAARVGADVAISGSGLPAPVGTVAGQAGTSYAVNTGTGKGTSAVQDVYQQLLNLMNARVPFDVYTGKRVYRNMLIRTLAVQTDVRSENSLMAEIGCREVFIVQTEVVSVGAAAADQALPQQTQPVANQGTKQPAAVDPAANPALAAEVAQSFPRRDR